MSLTSDMTQLTEKLEAAQEGRLSAVYEDLEQIMVEHARRVDSDLKGIFSQAAIIRGRADDLIDRYAAERQRGGEQLRSELADFASGLRGFVEALVDDYASDREMMSAREAAIRAAYLTDLRARVEAILSDAESFVGALREDHLRASRIWQQYARKQSKRRADVRSSKLAFRPKAAPKTKASQPPSAEPKPPSAAQQPASATSKPAGAASKPMSAASKPASAASKPVSAASKPASAASKPASAASKPASGGRGSER